MLCWHNAVLLLHNNHLVRVWKSSCFGLKYLFLSPQTQLETRLLNVCVMTRTDLNVVVGVVGMLTANISLWWMSEVINLILLHRDLCCDCYLMMMFFWCRHTALLLHVSRQMKYTNLNIALICLFSQLSH